MTLMHVFMKWLQFINLFCVLTILPAFLLERENQNKRNIKMRWLLPVLPEIIRAAPLACSHGYSVDVIGEGRGAKIPAWYMVCLSGMGEEERDRSAWQDCSVARSMSHLAHIAWWGRTASGDGYVSSSEIHKSAIQALHAVCEPLWKDPSLNLVKRCWHRTVSQVYLLKHCVTSAIQKAFPSLYFLLNPNSRF